MTLLWLLIFGALNNREALYNGSSHTFFWGSENVVFAERKIIIENNIFVCNKFFYITKQLNM